mmetsp:Transcript_15184/g.11039  ORF Transcript_15184/g.11039 Transcript_15184/m.11039 type:complete len:87 (-) Transcript_15184:144-404(-)
MGLYPGQVTDDSEMALCIIKAIVESIREGKTGYDLNMFTKYFALWVKSHPIAIGKSIAAALEQTKKESPVEYLELFAAAKEKNEAA